VNHDPVTHHQEGVDAPDGGTDVVVRLPIPVRRDPVPTHRTDVSTGIQADVRAAAARVATGPGRGDGAFIIDCADCAHRGTAVCDDCVVSFIVGRVPEDALVVDAAEARAVRLLERAGLVPGVRHESQVSGL